MNLLNTKGWQPYEYFKFSGTFEVSIQNIIIMWNNSPKYENREKISKK